MAKFRMALLSGEVETHVASRSARALELGSGWLCYPGKLKPSYSSISPATTKPGFRMALLSGEVETFSCSKEPSDKPTMVPDGFAIQGS